MPLLLTLSVLFFMQSGLTVFNSMRTEVFPQDCTSKASSVGAAGTTTITLPDVDHIRTGMAVYGLGVAYGTRVTGISGANVVVSAANTAAVPGPPVLAVRHLSTAGSVCRSNTISVVNSTGIAVVWRFLELVSRLVPWLPQFRTNITLSVPQ